MNKSSVTLALAAAIAVSALSAGEAQARGRHDGAHLQRPAATHANRAGPRGLRAHRYATRRLSAPKRHRYRRRAMTHGRHLRPYYRWHGPRGPHRSHGPLRSVRVLREYTPAPSRALEIETPEFRFSVNASG